MAAGTLLPLFWELASADKQSRINSSVKLISALEQFQEKFLSQGNPKADESEASSEDEGESGDGNDKGIEEYTASSRKLDKDNAADISYSIRRLIRGLASPRESSRLGFAVAFTELLSQMDTVSCYQILTLLKKESQTTGSMSGQEERDMLFARLFGLKAIIQSGLLTREASLRMSSTSASSLDSFTAVLSELLSLAEKKSWLKESCWWTLMTTIDKVNVSNVPWKQDAFKIIFDYVFIKDAAWGPEKIAVAVQLQRLCPSIEWSKYCGTYLKNPEVLSPANFSILARILKDSDSEESAEAEHKVHVSGPWKPQLHFAWNVILDGLLKSNKKMGRFQDFYRIVVDETLFSTTSSPQRKYWGFQVFQNALQRLPSSDLSMLFTKNFMRTWINHLSKSDRHLHKLAQQVAADLQKVVEENPKTGFSLVLQLTGTNGSFHFDRVTKTKTVETILSNTTTDGIKEYVEYLLKHFNDGKEVGELSLDSQRIWIVDQMSSLLRRSTIPKTDETIDLILGWLTTNAFFDVKKPKKKSGSLALRVILDPPLSPELHELCSTRLLACLADLSTLSLPHNGKNDNAKASNVPGTASNGGFWVSKVLELLDELEKDTKHVNQRRELEAEASEVKDEAYKVVKELKASIESTETSAGSVLLLSTLVLKSMCDEEADWDAVTDCAQAAKQLLNELAQNKDEKKKKQKSDNEEKEDASPIDLLIDIIIGLLESSTSFTRTMANQSFAMLTPLMTESTVGLILAQLERRDPSKDEEEEGKEDNEDEEQNSNANGSGSDEDSDEKNNVNDEDDESGDTEENTEELRKALSAAMAEDGMEDEGSEGSSEGSMDDEQMMAIDEKLAAVFRTRQEERKKGKDTGAQREATYFKNRVLDLVDTFLRKQPSSSLVLRFILPLVEIVKTASTDEKQLSDKAKGILRSRYSKPRDVPSADVSEAASSLESLHKIARRAHSSEIVSTISMCSLFVTRSLIASGEQIAQARIYEDSVKDFITRKASGLNTAFITGFIRRCPLLAWGARTVTIEAIPEAVNGYRQTQAFVIIQTLITQLPQQDTKKAEMIIYMQLVSEAFLASIHYSCSSEKPLLTAAQMKDTLKCATQLCRFSKRLADEKTPISHVWKPAKWSDLAMKLSESDTFKASVSLTKACEQISTLAKDNSVDKASKIDRKTVSSSEGRPRSTSKRKQEEGAGEGTDSELKPKKPKRKKVLKASVEKV